jgi:raffinose/stachyose/melibiose transport system permease protein
MVQKPSRRRATFVVFVAPALVLYTLFFLLPFFQGLRISFTNWDGLTPKSPISMPAAEFQSKILDKIRSESDRNFVLSIYSFDSSAASYARLSISGLKRYRLESILRGVGYSPDSYRDVGFKNYSTIFSGKVDARFYPRTYEQVNFNPNSSLPQQIDKTAFEHGFLSKLDIAGKALASSYYSLNGTAYVLNPAFDEFTIEDAAYNLPEALSGKVKSEKVDSLVQNIQNAGLAKDSKAVTVSVDSFVATNHISASNADKLRKMASKLYEIGAFKTLLSDTWRQTKFDLGVVGFTIFFALGNVIFANLLAFWLAMALDRKLKTKNMLRSVFFLPNVLSMIVVALVWSFVFFHLFPKITGIDRWMSDPAKAPWLLVMVSTWQAAGYYMVVYLAGLQNIPQEVLEAAMIDGASYRTQLRHITLPLLMPAFTVCVFLSIANALKSFDLVYAMVGPSGYAIGTVPFVMDIFFDAFAKKLAGLATAKATLLFLTILIVTGIQLLVMKKKEVQL